MNDMNGAMSNKVIAPIPNRYCEVCYAPATRAVRDMQQIGADGEDWATFEPAPDGWHFYCEEHKRESVTTYLDEANDAS